MTQDERKKLWPKWRKLVNMTASQIQAFLDTSEGKAAGLSREEASKEGIARGRDSARALIRMLPSGGRSYEQAERNWSDNDWEWAKRQYSFISRMRKSSGPLHKDGEMTRKLTSLLIWGHDPRRKKNPSEKQYKDYTLYATDNSSRNEWNVEAYAPGWKLAGVAEFAGVYEYDDEGSHLVALKGWQVDVKPEHRRKGLASAMYCFAEEAFGLSVQPGDVQTEEGAAFLGGRDCSRLKAKLLR